MREAQQKIKAEYIVTGLVLAAMSYFIFFQRLDTFQIRPWDEAIYANNAYEMWQSGKYFMLTNHFVNDLYNTKPLLPFWTQVLSFSLFGFNEMAVRLPSAVASMFTALMVFMFVRRYASATWGWTAFFVLVTSAGFVHFHTARTGDMDALLTLFLTGSCLAFFNLLQEESPKRNSILFYLLFLALAFASKTFAALLFLPAQIVLLVYYKKLAAIVKHRAFYAGTAIALLIALLPLVLRNIEQPGYLVRTFSFDALRVANVVENHNEPFGFYFINFFTWRFPTWIVVSFLGLIMMVRSPETSTRKLGIAIAASLISYLLIISFSVTKLEWYDMPLYPLMAIAAGYLVWQVLLLAGIEKYKWSVRQAWLLGVFFIPAFYAVKRSNDNTISPGDQKAEELSAYLFRAGRTDIDVDKWIVIQDWHRQCLDFYQRKFAENNQQLRIVPAVDSLRPGDHVLAAGDSIKDLIRGQFETREEQRYNDVYAFEIVSMK